MLQLDWQVESLFDVEPQAFNPPPKVMSQVVRLTPLAQPVAVKSKSELRRVVAAAFGQRRKTLNNSLRDYAFDFPAFGLEGSQRAEQLSVEQFVALANFSVDNPAAG